MTRSRAYQESLESLGLSPGRWLVTGVAGFIGSHLLESLLLHDQEVVGIDNFSTGSRRNLDDVAGNVGAERWGRFEFHEADVHDLDACREVTRGVDVVLHQAALGSVPRSMTDPVGSHQSNVTGTLHTLIAAKEAGVKRFVYASSSSVYGDHPDLPKVEEEVGDPLSPYAATKAACETYGRTWAHAFGLSVVGLRYFNVFGPRQDPDGPYAAVIPKWIGAMTTGEPVEIYGDGETSRDFCYVANAVQANLLAATTKAPLTPGAVFNVAVGERTTLNHLFELIRERVAGKREEVDRIEPRYGDFRPGDVRHSLADVSKARETLGYVPSHDIEAGLDETVRWFLADEPRARAAADRTA